jgi:hypothetical protein
MTLDILSVGLFRGVANAAAPEEAALANAAVSEEATVANATVANAAAPEEAAVPKKPLSLMPLSLNRR